MNWLTDRTSFAIAVVLYGISVVYSVFLWRRGFRQDNRINYLILAAAFVFHMFAMVKRGHLYERCPVNNLYEATTFISWALAGAYLVVGIWRPLRFVGVFASPILLGLGIFALMPGMDPPHGPKPEFSGGWTNLHATLSLLAYGAFGLSAVAAAMYLAQQYDLKFRKARAIVSLLPPVGRLEIIAARALVAGFLLLTAGLVVGMFWLKVKNGVYLSTDIKVLWSGFVWVLYLTLLVVRQFYVRGGRRLAWGTIGSFAFVMLTFWGVYLLSPIHR